MKADKSHLHVQSQSAQVGYLWKLHFVTLVENRGYLQISKDLYLIKLPTQFKDYATHKNLNKYLNNQG